MSEIRKHIEENCKEANIAYLDAYDRLNKLKKVLTEAQQRYDWVKIDFDKKSEERDYYEKLLNELNDENHE